jgi:hypothetical protein
MDIRAAELTADHLGRTVKIDPGDETFVMGRLVQILHKPVIDGDVTGTETRLAVEVLADQLVRVRFNAIDVVELF